MMPKHQDDLRSLLDSIEPEVLLVEVVQEDLKIESLSSYPEEMKISYDWAKSKGIEVFGFDAAITVTKEGLSPEAEIKVSEKQLDGLKGSTWKDANRPEFDALNELAQPLIDEAKWNERENRMAEVISGFRDKRNKTLILTGTWHLKFFERVFPDSSFPLRKLND